jgi:toxin YoeB
MKEQQQQPKYKVVLTEQAKKDIEIHVGSGNIPLVGKIEKLLIELEHHPRKGTGKVEHLKTKTKKEYWSRRLDKKHRIVYNIFDDTVIVLVLSAYGHYGKNNSKLKFSYDE